MLEPLVKNLSVMSLELRAEIALNKKQTEEAKKLFAQAEKEEKDLGYHEPPFYVRPVAETEGAALMAASDWTGAKAAYEKALAERPNSGFSLYGIALSSERGGDSKGANAKYLEFVTAWKDADTELPELAHAQAFLAEHKSLASGN
jgi:tetratricopeptide (TPR) repeat protein